MSHQIALNRLSCVFKLGSALGLSVFLSACAVVPPHQGYGYSNRYPVYSPPSTVFVQPRPVYVQPQSVYAQPQSVYAQPQSVYVQPQSVYVQPRPVYVQPYRPSPFMHRSDVVPHFHERGLNAIQRQRLERRHGAHRHAF